MRKVTNKIILCHLLTTDILHEDMCLNYMVYEEMVKEPRPLEEVLPIVVVGNLNYPVLCSCIMSATLGFASRMLMVTKVPTKQPLKGLGILHDSLTWTLQIDQVTDQWLLEGHQTWPCTWAFPAL